MSHMSDLHLRATEAGIDTNRPLAEVVARVAAAEMEPCGECGTPLPPAVNDAIELLYGGRRLDVADLKRALVASYCVRTYRRRHGWTDEDYALDALRTWLKVDDLGALTAAVRHVGQGRCAAAQDRRAREEATT